MGFESVMDYLVIPVCFSSSIYVNSDGNNYTGRLSFGESMIKNLKIYLQFEETDDLKVQLQLAVNLL